MDLFTDLIIIRNQLEARISLIKSIVNISELEKTAEIEGLEYALTLINNLINSQLN